MAEKKVIELDVQSNLGSLKSQLKQAQQEVQVLSEKFGATSKEAVNAAKQAAILKDKIGDAKSLTDAFNPDAKFKALSGSLTGVAGGFSVVTGAMGAFGKQSEEVEGALLKVQSAMALASGAQAIGESIDSFKQLGAVLKANAIVQKVMTAVTWLYNAALAANPVMAIVAGIAALIAIGYKLITMFQDSAQANDEAAAATKRNTTALNNQIAASDRASNALKTKNGHEYNMAKASGASAEALRKLALKHADEEIALEKATLATARNTYEKEKNTLANYKNLGVSDDIIEKQRELVTKSREALKEEYKDLKDAYKNRQAVAQQNEVERKQEQTDSKNNAIAAEQEKNQKIAESNAESVAKSKEALDEIAKNQRDATDVFKTEYELQVRAIEEKYKAEIELAKKYGKDTVDLEKARKKELQDLEDAQAKDLFDGTEKLVLLDAKKTEVVVGGEKKRAEETKTQLVGVQEVRERISDAEQAIEDKKKANLTKGLEETAKVLGDISDLFGKQSKAGKVAAIAEATIQTYLSAQKAYASTIGVPVVGPVLAPIAAGVAIAAGLKNIKSIASVKVPNDTGGGTPPPTDTGGGGGTSVISPSFNVVGNSGMNQLAQLQQTPAKAYVVSGDVTSAQSLDRNRIENATLVQ
jgi:hypothetical protein